MSQKAFTENVKSQSIGLIALNHSQNRSVLCDPKDIMRLDLRFKIKLLIPNLVDQSRPYR